MEYIICTKYLVMQNVICRESPKVVIYLNDILITEDTDEEHL